MFVLGCDSWKDLFPPGAYQNQAHGAGSHSPRDRRRGSEYTQRVREYRQIRVDGWRADKRRMRPYSSLPFLTGSNPYLSLDLQRFLRTVFLESGTRR